MKCFHIDGARISTEGGLSRFGDILDFFYLIARKFGDHIEILTFVFFEHILDLLLSELGPLVGNLTFVHHEVHPEVPHHVVEQVVAFHLDHGFQFLLSVELGPFYILVDHFVFLAF